MPQCRDSASRTTRVSWQPSPRGCSSSSSSRSWFSARAATSTPTFATSALLFGLTVINFSLLLVLVFVLGRNLVRMLMEWRRGVFGARLRVQLLLVFLLMAVAPSVLAPPRGQRPDPPDRRPLVQRGRREDPRLVAGPRDLRCGSRPPTAAGSTPRPSLARSGPGACSGAEQLGASPPDGEGPGPRARDRPGQRLHSARARSSRSWIPACRRPRRGTRPRRRRWPTAALGGREAEAIVAFGAGELARVAVPVRGADGSAEGAVVVSGFVPAEVARAARDVHDHYTKFRKTQTYREPILSFYRSLYLFPALLILFGAVWLALYLARRITTPAAAGGPGRGAHRRRAHGVRRGLPVRERGAPRPDRVVQPHVGAPGAHRGGGRVRPGRPAPQEPGAGGAAPAHRDRPRDRGHRGPRRRTRRAPSPRSTPPPSVCWSWRAARWGCRSTGSCAGPGRDEIRGLVLRLLSGRVARQEREVLVPSRDRDRHLAVTVVSLPGSLGSAPGRAGGGGRPDPADEGPEGGGVGRGGPQARPRDQEPAHPDPALRPADAQGVAQVRPRFRPGADASAARAIVDEVEALKNLVDEFAQFARLPAASLRPTSLHEVIDQALSLYEGLFPGIVIERREAADLPELRLDPDQMKRVLINLVDNSIAAMDERGRILVATEYDRAEGPGPPDRGRRRSRDRPRRSRPALRPPLLHQEAGERPRPGHRQPHRAGASRDDQGRGQRSPRAPASSWSCRRERRRAVASTGVEPQEIDV